MGKIKSLKRSIVIIGRGKKPLKKMQSVIAVASKLIRIFYTILTKGVDYDSQKMLNDIVRPEIRSSIKRKRQCIMVGLSL